MRTILFLLLFVSFCCMHLYFMFTAVSYQMFFHWCSAFMFPHWGFWNKLLDLIWLSMAAANSKHWFTTSFLWRKVPESDARSVWLLLSVCSVSEQKQRRCAWPSCPYWRHWLGTHTKTRKGLKAHSSGTVWVQVAVRPNEPHGFRGRKAVELCSRTGLSLSLICQQTSEDIKHHLKTWTYFVENIEGTSTSLVSALHDKTLRHA